MLNVWLLFMRGPESKIGRGDYASTGAGYKISRKNWTVLNYKTLL
jgi:hypothetical protein